MRIQRALARSGITSRRRAEDLVAAGRVSVNGAVASIGQIVDIASDKITLDGKRVQPPADAQWIMLNKPAGVMTTRADPSGRRTVFDLVHDVPGLTYVGRLDYLTEGLLLLTTDGTAAHLLTHPSRQVERSYVATVKGDAPGAARALLEGADLEDGPVIARHASAESLGGGRWSLTLTLAEGRNREVRRACQSLGLSVERLIRTRFGPIVLGGLGTGDTRRLTSREERAIAALVGAQDR
ncbi:MAG: pseudouridine synthase [Gemmatimonadaceae bacterium]